MRRVITAVFVALLLIAMGTFAAFAAEEPVALEPVFATNPLCPEYAVGETAPILNAGEEAPALYTAASLDDMAVTLRNAMENRQSSVRIALPDEHTPASEDAYYVWDLALEETGVPTQGDYLRWHWSTWGCEWDYEWTGSFYRYYMIFTVSYLTTAEQEEELTARVDEIIDGFGFSSATSDYDKVKTIYTWVTDNITYDYTSSGKMKQTCYNGVMTGSCVCQGYASTMYRMLWQVGVPARIIPGDTNATPTPSKDDTDDNHGWNIVKLGDSWYNLDATWDAGGSEANWDYFLCSADGFPEHYRWPEYDTADFHAAYPMAEENYAFPYGDCGENLSWILGDNGLLTISGTGTMNDYGSQYDTPWYASQSSIKNIILCEGVTSVGDNAFYGCESLTSVTMPNAVTIIGEFAFSGCSNLVDITIPNSVISINSNAFSSCTSLSNIIIPDSVTSIGAWAFSFCTNLTHVTMGNGITSIGVSAFERCDKLLYNIYDNAKYLGNKANPYVVLVDVSQEVSSCEIHKDTKVIGSYALTGCDLICLDIPEGVVGISSRAFDSCGLTRLIIPSSVTRIDHAAFAYCTALTDIVFAGDAPVFDPSLFYWVRATAYYPSENDTWTEDVLKDYSGDITWVAYTPEPEIEKFDFYGTNMTLGNTLEINFLVASANITGDDNYIVITKQYADDRGLVTKTIPQSEWKSIGNMYKYASFTVSAKEMNDPLTATVYNAAGEQISTVREDSVAGYCVRMLGKEAEKAAPDAKKMALYVDMVNYGAAAQGEWDYNVENLANAGLTEEQKALVTVVTEKANNQVKGTGYAGATLSLLDNIILNFVYNNSTIDNAAYAVVTYTDHYGNPVEYTVEASEFENFSETRKYVAVNTLKVADCRQVVTVELFDAEGKSLSISKDSVESYTARMSGNLYEMILAFGVSAYNYFHT